MNIMENKKPKKEPKYDPDDKFGGDAFGSSAIVSDMIKKGEIKLDSYNKKKSEK